MRLAQWRDEVGISNWKKPAQMRMALRLFESSVGEDKLAGILFLQEYLYDQFEWRALLPKYERLYAKGLIFDWNTCEEMWSQPPLTCGSDKRKRTETALPCL